MHIVGNIFKFHSEQLILSIALSFSHSRY